MKIPLNVIIRIFAPVVFAIILTACGVTQKRSTVIEESPREITIIGINDVYNIEGVDAQQSGGLARLKSLRDQVGTKSSPALLLLAGDFLFPSQMSSNFSGDLITLLLAIMNSTREK